MKVRVFKGERIKPIRKTISGILEAPTLYITEEDGLRIGSQTQYEDAIKIAREKSGLSKFESWEFV